MSAKARFIDGCRNRVAVSCQGVVNIGLIMNQKVWISSAVAVTQRFHFFAQALHKKISNFGIRQRIFTDLEEIEGAVLIEVSGWIFLRVVSRASLLARADQNHTGDQKGAQ